MSASNHLAAEHDRACTGQGSPSFANFTVIRLEQALAEARAALIEMNERLQERTQGMLARQVELRNRVRELERQRGPIEPDPDFCAGVCEDCGAGSLDLLPRGGALLCDVCRVERGWAA